MHEGKKCKITNFADPHLFFVLYDDAKTGLHDLEATLCTRFVDKIVQYPKTDQIYVVKHEGKVKRAIALSKPGSYYFCWLIDYGELVREKHFYALPPDCHSKPLSIKAGLNKTVGLEAYIDDTGSNKFTASCKFTPGACISVKNLIATAKEIYFKEDLVVRNVHFGEIYLVMNDGSTVNVINQMERNNILAIDEHLFDQMIGKSLEVMNYIKQLPTEEDVGIGRGCSRNSRKLLAKPTTSNEEYVHKWLASTPYEISLLTDSCMSRAPENSDTDSSFSEVDYGMSKSNRKKKSPACVMKKIREKLHTSLNVSVESSDIEANNTLSKADKCKNRNESISGIDNFNNNECITNRTPIETSLKKLTSENISSGKSVSNVASDQPSSIDILQECKSSNSSIISALRKLKSTSTEYVSSNFTESDSDIVSDKSEIAASEKSEVTVSEKSEVTASEKSENVHSESFMKSNNNTAEEEEEDTGDYFNRNKPLIRGLRCNCADCEHWDEGDFDSKPEEFKAKKIKATVKPALLFREDDNANVPLSKSINEKDEFSTTKTMIMPNVLVHGTVSLYPQHYVADMPFLEPIHRSMRVLELLKCKPVQQYGWPAMMRGMNLCIVDIASNDKTMTYVVALCSLLMEADRYHHLPEGNGPKVLVLCSESKTVERVYHRFYEVLTKTRSKVTIKLLQAIAPLNPALMHQFKSPCDILITTPVILVTFLAKHTFNLKRLCHLIVEDIDDIFTRQKVVIERILKVVQTMLKHRTCSKQVQFICTSQHWTYPIENLMKQLNSVPVVIIGNPLEAALYGRTDISITEVQSNTKNLKLYEIIQDKYRVYKTIVVCKEEEIEALQKLFELYGISFLIAHDRMSSQDTMEVYKSWSSRSGGLYVVLICTDFALRKQMNVRDCAILINYTLDTTWSDFVKRWLCLFDNYKSPLNDNQDGFTCKIYIFIDEKSGMEITKIVNYFKSVGITIPPNVIEHCEEHKKSVETNKINNKRPLCHNWKENATCMASNCADRHVLDAELDQPLLPISGTLKFRVASVLDVNVYQIVPLQFTRADGETHEFKDTKPQIEKLLKESKMKEFVMEAKVGEMYLLEEDKQFFRCVVRRIIECDRLTKMPSKVTVECIDEGGIKRVLTGNLFEVPEKLKQIPSSLMELYVVNIIPLNNEKYWSERARKQLTGNFTGNKIDQYYCTGKVALHLSNTVWMENFQVHSQLSCMTQILTYFTLLPFLVQQNIAKVEKGKLTQFYDACDMYGLSKPQYDLTTEVKVVVKQVKPQWAFIPSDEQFNAVTFSSGFTPRRFYVKLKKFSDLYKKFEESIQCLLQQRSLQLKQEEIIAGNCYLAPDPENEAVYSRAIVTSVTEEEASCFYVDYGDVANISLKDIKFLPNDYITRLPFQCIECSLHGIDTCEDEWTDEALDILYQYCMEKNGESFRTLYTFTMSEEPGHFTANKKYNIQLYDNSENIPKIINKVMIDCGFAIPNPNEPLNLEAKLEVRINECQSDDEETKENIIGVDESSDDDDLDGFDYVCDNVEDFMKEINILSNFMPKGTEKSIESKPTTSTKQKKDNLPEMKALPVSNIFTPTVEWHQTEEEIKICIKLSVTEYQIKLIAGRALTFSAEYSNRAYALKLQLFDLVNRTFRHKLSGFAVNVTLKKVKPVKWPHLTLSVEPNRKIRYNIEKVEGLDDEDDVGILQKVRDRKQITTAIDDGGDEEDDDCYYDEIGSDNSDSDFSEDISD